MKTTALILLATLVLASNPVMAQDEKTSSATIDQDPTPAQATFKVWDTNHDGALSLDEFRAGAAKMEAAITDRRLRTQFNTMDQNKDGAIDDKEYGSLLLIKRAGSSAPTLSTFDINHDQKLNYAEYVELVRRLSSTDNPIRHSSPAS